MILLLKKTLGFLVVILSFSVIVFPQAGNFSINTDFDEETNKTTVLLKGIELPQNKDSFAIGAFFEFTGDKLEKPLCCAGIFFTSISRKKFNYEKNHSLKIWADKKIFTFNDVNWQESAEGTAFIIAQLAFPEEMFVGMKSEIFQKIANAKKVKMQLGNFKFTLTSEHLTGFKKLVEKMKKV